MRRLSPLLALALVCCSDDPESSPRTDDSAERDDNDRDSERDDARDAGSKLDARAPIDAAIVDARSDSRADARVIVDARVEDARVIEDAGPQKPDSGTKFDVEPNANTLTYLGTNGNDPACARELRTVGYAPKDDAKHPLFLYFIGTQVFAQDESSYYDSAATKRVTEAMARRGFVAYSVEYDNLLGSFLVDKTKCLYQDPKGLLKKACALPNVDCSLGIATWGHSQGALLAHSAAQYDDRVRAVWTTGYSGLTGAKLPANRFRVVNGEGDTMNASLDVLNRTAGASCTSGDSCLRDDGSGWIIVRKAASKTNNADHCWFDKANCGSNTLNLEPNWIDPASTALFALEKNADWVAATIKRP